MNAEQTINDVKTTSIPLRVKENRRYLDAFSVILKTKLAQKTVKDFSLCHLLAQM
jgi:hypothetical protein